MIPLSKDEKSLLSECNQLIEQCRVSQMTRAAYYRTLNVLSETGRFDGTKSKINMLYNHLFRTATHLFSPVELKFSMDFDNIYPAEQIKRGNVFATHVTRHWERSSLDNTFQRGGFESLKYGSAILKQWPTMEGKDQNIPKYHHKLVMPWNFGVYREDENNIEDQEVVCETITMTLPEVWQRIYRFPNAKRLYQEISAHAKSGEAMGEPNSFFHQVLSTSQLNTGVQGMTRPIPGGIVQLNNDPNFSIMGPMIGAPIVKMHELWVKGEEDYQTVQIIEPDILITRFKISNLFIADSQMQPYTLIQPNEVTNWFWGRSELIDMIEPQALLSQLVEDMARLIGVQVDKILFFVGDTGIQDEQYGQMRMAGYGNLPQGADVKDMTPKFPAELQQVIKFLIETINMLGGFPDIMQGKGESGVRAGTHANTLLKTASPTLRDRALLMERQCAIAADKTASLMEAKETRKFWTKADTLQDAEQTTFILGDLPDDWRITVDSHSSSPIFSDENQQLIFALRKTNDVDGEYAIKNLPLPNKEEALASLRERKKSQQEQQEKILKQFPEAGEKIAVKQLTGSRR